MGNIPMDFLISTANAQAEPGAAGPNDMSQMLVIRWPCFGAFYLMLIRPAKKKAKEAREMVATLAVGDEVVTAGGILGRIAAAGDTYLSIEVARDTTIQLQRYQVVQAASERHLQERLIDARRGATFPNEPISSLEEPAVCRRHDPRPTDRLARTCSDRRQHFRPSRKDGECFAGDDCAE
jgi:preprotein translocase subunit YajC